MSGFKAGDIAVKVFGPCTTIPKGAVLKVISVVFGVDENGEIVAALTFDEYKEPGFIGFAAHNFRKIRKADTAFTAQMRALKPVKQKA